ncbi:HNH endonuclease [Mesomycoplasma hyorhinis]|uniref:MAG4270 family putative restriction endonuclease n=1 Tax=Mesomycoplasma hyorhinis TaxID=2100 RepID=UPI00220BA05F|nr:HNH endonuclease [Mesomycoplasma hyorhinis]
MAINKNIYWDEINIVSNNFKKEDRFAAKFKGKIKFIYDYSSLVIHYFHYELEMCEIDILTTQSWFKSMNTNFKKREKVFSLLGLQQKPRASKIDHHLVNLSQDQLKKLNHFLKYDYESTIKNIIALTRGSNPSGELMSPNNAPIILEKEDLYFKNNFAIFFTNFFYPIVEIEDLREQIFNDTSKKQNYFQLFVQKATQQDSKFFKILKIIQYLSNHNKNFYERKDLGKKKLKELKELISIKNIEKDIKNSRQKFQQNIAKQQNMLFDFLPKEKAHIWPVSEIKRELIKIDKQSNNQNEYQKLLFAIEDYENCLVLSPDLHTAFDKNWFTFDEVTGHLIFMENNKEIQEFRTQLVKDGRINKIIQIPPKFFTKNRQKYLEKRNKKHII